jgi:hypothetical protein
MTQSGLYGFVSLDGRAVARDIFLDGNTFTDSHQIDKKYFVSRRHRLAMAGRQDHLFTVPAQQEVRTQQEEQSFGSLLLSLEY